MPRVAGLQAGWIIISVNDQPVLHPDALNRMVSKPGQIRLKVADPRTNREMTVDVTR